VGHRVDGGVAAHRGGLRPRLDGLGVLPAGLAQMGVQVHQTRQRDQPVGVDDLRPGLVQPGPHPGDDAVAHQDVGGLPTENPSTLDHELHGETTSWPMAGSEPPSSRYRTAMRALTPLATWSTMVERTESATSAAISTPRFIGPGCMTMACSGSSAMRSASRPWRRLYSRTVVQ